MNKKRKIISFVFLIIGCVLSVIFVINAITDSLNYNMFYSAPLYVYIMADALTTLLPAIICFGISIFLKKYKKKK